MPKLCMNLFIKMSSRKIAKELAPAPQTINFKPASDLKGFQATAQLASTNVEHTEGIKGSIIFDNLETQCLAVYGILLRKEEVNVLSTANKRITPYQSIQLLYGQPQVGTYPFYFSLPKNYCCESVVNKSGPFYVSFAFAIKLVLKSGHILLGQTDIKIYRKKKEKVEEIDSDENN